MKVLQFSIKKPRKKATRKKAKKLSKKALSRRRNQISILKKLGFRKVKFDPETGERKDGLFQAPEGKCKQTVVKV